MKSLISFPNLKLEIVYAFSDEQFEQTPGDSEEPGKPGVLQSILSQRARHDWASEQ